MQFSMFLEQMAQHTTNRTLVGKLLILDLIDLTLAPPP